MKAIMHDAYGEPSDVLQLRDIETPAIGDDQVLVRVHAAGIDPGIWHLVRGLPYIVRIMGYGFSKPKHLIPGWDMAGRVEAVGKDVTRYQAGDDVFGCANGTLAEYACTREQNIALKPDSLSYEQAAVVYVSGVTALVAIRDEGKVQRGQSVLVVGAGGGVGTYTVQIAKSYGAVVTGVCSTGKVDLVRSLGADQVIDYTKDDFTAGDVRYDVIIVMAGDHSTSRLRRILAPEGTLVLVGGEDGGRLIGGLHRSIAGMIAAMFSRQRVRLLLPRVDYHNLVVLKELVDAGAIRPVLDRSFPLSEYLEALRYVEEGRARGKVAVTI